MRRTNIVLDETLVKRAMKMTGATTKRRVVDLALRELVKHRTTYKTLMGLRGKLAWQGDLDSWRRSRV